MKFFTTSGLVLAATLATTGAAHAGDAAAGRSLFERTCANCHSTEAGVNKVGPTLFDIVDRPIASVQGYDYSPKMKSQRKRHKVWSDRQLDAYLTNPREVLHGVKMYFAVPDAKDRSDLMAYLVTIK